MCIIIDANVAHTIWTNPPDLDGEPVRSAVEAGKNRIASGGKKAEELEKTKIRRWFLEQWRRGVVQIYAPERLRLEEQTINRKDVCVSNDCHVIALSRISGARLLFTKDRLLQEDFKNRELVRDPKGRVYSSRRNMALLARVNTCR